MAAPAGCLPIGWDARPGIWGAGDLLAHPVCTFSCTRLVAPPATRHPCCYTLPLRPPADRAQAVFDEMLASGLEPGMPTWSALLNAYADSKQVGAWLPAAAEAWAYDWGTTCLVGMVGNAWTCEHAVQPAGVPAAAPGKQPLRAVEALKLMRAQNLKPSVKVWGREQCGWLGMLRAV